MGLSVVLRNNDLFAYMYFDFDDELIIQGSHTYIVCILKIREENN